MSNHGPFLSYLLKKRHMYNHEQQQQWQSKGI